MKSIAWYHIPDNVVCRRGKIAQIANWLTKRFVNDSIGTLYRGESIERQAIVCIPIVMDEFAWIAIQSHTTCSIQLDIRQWSRDATDIDF
jgi:hypothetical protein